MSSTSSLAVDIASLRAFATKAYLAAAALNAAASVMQDQGAVSHRRIRDFADQSMAGIEKAVDLKHELLTSEAARQKIFKNAASDCDVAAEYLKSLSGIRTSRVIEDIRSGMSVPMPSTSASIRSLMLDRERACELTASKFIADATLSFRLKMATEARVFTSSGAWNRFTLWVESPSDYIQKHDVKLQAFGRVAADGTWTRENTIPKILVTIPPEKSSYSIAIAVAYTLEETCSDDTLLLQVSVLGVTTHVFARRQLLYASTDLPEMPRWAFINAASVCEKTNILAVTFGDDANEDEDVIAHVLVYDLGGGTVTLLGDYTAIDGVQLHRFARACVSSHDSVIVCDPFNKRVCESFFRDDGDAAALEARTRFTLKDINAVVISIVHISPDFVPLAIGTDTQIHVYNYSHGPSQLFTINCACEGVLSAWFTPMGGLRIAAVNARTRTMQVYGDKVDDDGQRVPQAQSTVHASDARYDDVYLVPTRANEILLADTRYVTTYDSKFAEATCDANEFIFQKAGRHLLTADTSVYDSSDASSLKSHLVTATCYNNVITIGKYVFEHTPCLS